MSASFSRSDAQGVGDIGQAILQHTPPPARQVVAPFILRIVEGFHSAFALAEGTVFWVAVIAGVLALLAALSVEDIPLRGGGAHAGGLATRRPADPAAKAGAAVPAL